MQEPSEQHFNKTFFYICFTTFAVFLYIFAATWIPIPKENMQFAYTAQGILMGSVLTAGAGYLLGGSPSAVIKKPAAGQPGTTTTADISGTITTTADPVPGEVKPLT